MKSQIAERRAYNGGGRDVTSPAEHLADIEPIGRSSTEQRATKALRELIVAGRLPEGTPLVQRDLAERLGISQTPIRHALVALERAGLVEVGDNGRALVRRLTREDLEELYAARLGLEGLAARLGAAAVGPAELERMRELLAGLDRLARAQDVDAYLRGALGAPLHRVPRLRPHAPRRRGRAAVLARRRYHRLVLSIAGAVQPVGRLVPRLRRRLRRARRRTAPSGSSTTACAGPST